MGRRSSALLLVALAVCCLFAAPALSKAKKRTKKELSEDSVGCKTCKRIVMSFHKAIFPRLEHTKGKLNSPAYKGALEQVLQEEMETVCTFDSLHYSRDIKKECEEINDAHGDDLVRDILRHVKAPDGVFELSDLMVRMCHDTARRCPRGAVSYASEEPPPRDQLRTEHRLEEEEQGVFRKIVAESWDEEVMDPHKDVLTFLYSTHGDKAWKDTMDAMEQAAEILKGCPTVRLGHLNLLDNMIPPPHGDYLEGDGIAIWRGHSHDKEEGRAHKVSPVWVTQNFREEGLTPYDILNFIMKSLGSQESFECVRKISNSATRDSISKLQQRKQGEDGEL